jgi:hypothetical protein
VDGRCHCFIAESVSRNFRVPSWPRNVPCSWLLPSDSLNHAETQPSLPPFVENLPSILQAVTVEPGIPGPETTEPRPLRSRPSDAVRCCCYTCRSFLFEQPAPENPSKRQDISSNLIPIHPRGFRFDFPTGIFRRCIPRPARRCTRMSGSSRPPSLSLPSKSLPYRVVDLFHPHRLPYPTNSLYPILDVRHCCGFWWPA